MAIESYFPVGSLIPKAETGVSNFLQKYPDYNGNDVTIAIFDSGVDPKAAGLEKLPDGSIKVIQRFDCSGCGDTDVSKKVMAVDGNLTGLSGKVLKLSNYMKLYNKNGNEFRIGLKSLYDLYPLKIRDKVASDNKLKKWDEPHKTATANIARELFKLESQNLETHNLTFKDKLRKDDLELSMEFLNNFEKKYFEIRTTYDCILFPTDMGWKAVIDNTENGDLENAVLIGEYNDTHEMKSLDDYLSISINVHDEGNTLEIVGMCSSHGTHVASIASGNNSNKDLDGVAPNAKIISLTIGDGRLGSMETGTALVRAMIKVMELCKAGTKIDVINMSYGEHAHWSSSGRIGKLMNEVVDQYGVIWVASAGNHGPALCTIGTPPDISQPSCIGVGAYISPQMMEAEYSLREKLPANVYTWTSRDPCIDGGQGVTVCAPGAAITSVPKFTMSRAQLMNGTSMAAPHVAGAVALLISGLKQKGIRYSPYSVKRALAVTATKLVHIDPFAQGSGLMNVEKAFEHLVQNEKAPETMIRFSVKVGTNAKGIHMRQGALTKSSEFNVAIEPIFFNEKETAPADKINFNVRLNLICTQPWVQCGAYLDLCYLSRSICVKVDPVGLPPGVHIASIKAYDTSCIEKGELFEIPVTVVQPHVTCNAEKARMFYSNGAIEFKPNTIQRDFILVPNNATWAVLKMTSVDSQENQIGKFFVHTMQILPMHYCKALETMKILPVNREIQTVLPFRVEQNNILELCIAKYWSNFGDTYIKYSLEFHGVAPTSVNATTMVAAEGIHRIELQGFGIEEISPNIQLKSATVILKPIDTKISPLSPQRDVIPAGRQIYQNILTYNLHVAKSQEISLYAPMLYATLYESEFESQFWMLFDSNKMLIKCGDAYSDVTFTKLEKGDYQIRLQVRHEKKDLLEKLQDINMLAVFKLQNIPIDVYEHFNQAVTGGKKFTNGYVNNQTIKPLFLAPVSNDRLLKANLPTQCAWLNGTIIFPKDEHGRKVNVSLFQYFLPDGPPQSKKSNNGSSVGSSGCNAVAATNSGSGSGNNYNNSTGNNNVIDFTDLGNGGTGGGGGNCNNNNNSPKKGKSKAEEYSDGLRDYQCAQIPKLDFNAAEELYNEMIKNHPNHLPIHLLFIQQLENYGYKAQMPFAFTKLYNADTDDQKLEKDKLIAKTKIIVELADIVINAIDKDALLAYYGIKSDTRNDANKIKSAMDKQKQHLLEALVKKGIALCKLIVIENKEGHVNGPNDLQFEQIDTIYMEIGKYIDCNDTKVVNFALWHAHAHSHFGRMAKNLQKLYEDKLSRDILDELAEAANVNMWHHIVLAVNHIAISANPMSYRPF